MDGVRRMTWGGARQTLHRACDRLEPAAAPYGLRSSSQADRRQSVFSELVSIMLATLGTCDQPTRDHFLHDRRLAGVMERRLDFFKGRAKDRDRLRIESSITEQFDDSSQRRLPRVPASQW